MISYKLLVTISPNLQPWCRWGKTKINWLDFEIKRSKSRSQLDHGQKLLKNAPFQHQVFKYHCYTCTNLTGLILYMPVTADERGVCG